jgi:HK97 family phage major capsid protein
LELTPHKLAGLTYASNELEADSAIPLQALIARQFGSAWGFYEDDAFLMGSGAGQPLGVFNCGCLKSVLRNTANRVHAEDIAEMYQSMLPSSLNSAVWAIGPTVMAELLELGSGNAADASGKILIWQPNFKDGIGAWTILGRPVIISEKLQALGTAGDILFADFRYYLIGDRQSLTIDSSTHVAFASDETCWRFVLRVAGQCWPQSTITSRRGAHTYSPFVQLSAATS